MRRSQRGIMVVSEERRRGRHRRRTAGVASGRQRLGAPGLGQCLKRVPLERPLRLLGVRVGALAKAGSPEALAPAGNARSAAPVATTASLF